MSDDFTGSDGADWNSSKWAVGYQPVNDQSGNAAAALYSNYGYLTAGASNYDDTYISRRVIIPPQQNVDITATFALQSPLQYMYYGTIAGIWVRADDTIKNSGYKLTIDEYGLTLYCPGTSCGPEIGQYGAGVSYSITPNVFYKVRFNVIGDQLRAKVWPASDSEPSEWMVDVTDTTFSDAGAVGVSTSSPYRSFIMDDFSVTGGL